MVTPAGQIYTYHYNGIGSTIAITDSGNNIVNEYSYTPFGEVSNQVELITQPFKFNGKYGVMYESDGLCYMRARYYYPQIQRFISEDPSGFSGGDLNLNAYCGNNPINYADPFGLCEQKYVDFSFSYSSFGEGETLSNGVWQKTKTIYDLVGADIAINIGWLPSPRDRVGELGLGVGDYLGIGYFFGRPNAAGDFQVGGLSIHVGVGLGTPVYVSATYPATVSSTRSVMPKDLVYKRQGGNG